MKYIVIILIFTTPFTSICQSKTFSGIYEKKSESDVGTVVEYKLNLKLDGTFSFHFYRNIDPTQPKENMYGKGMWELGKNNTINFYTNRSTDLDEKNTLDFNNSKARSNRKSPRNKSQTTIRESIMFYNSDIFWVKGLELYKSI